MRIIWIDLNLVPIYPYFRFFFIEDRFEPGIHRIVSVGPQDIVHNLSDIAFVTYNSKGTTLHYTTLLAHVLITIKQVELFYVTSDQGSVYGHLRVI